MIKKTLFNNNLIPIGNANFYNGKPVYSDGKVAYGWNYVGQFPTFARKPAGGGFWVGEESFVTDSYEYRLAGKNLLLEQSVKSFKHGSFQCYPCYATDKLATVQQGSLFKKSGGFSYYGTILAMSENGKLLTYDSWNLRFYNENGKYSRLDLSPLRYGLGIQCIDGFKNSGTVEHVIAENDSYRKAFQLATVDGAYIFALLSKKDSVGNQIYNANWSIRYPGQSFTGTGEVIDDGMDKIILDKII